LTGKNLCRETVGFGADAFMKNFGIIVAKEFVHMGFPETLRRK
jgi:hypothetical protein